MDAIDISQWEAELTIIAMAGLLLDSALDKLSFGEVTHNKGAPWPFQVLFGM
jgi:hypothetical protein